MFLLSQSNTFKLYLLYTVILFCHPCHCLADTIIPRNISFHLSSHKISIQRTTDVLSPVEYCPKNTFAFTSYVYNGNSNKDKTGVLGVHLICGSITEENDSNRTWLKPPLGDSREKYNNMQTNIKDCKNSLINGFSLKSSDDKSGDKVGVFDFNILCANNILPSKNKSDAFSDFQVCPIKSAVCSIQTEIDDGKTKWWKRRDARGMVNIKLGCCSIPQPSIQCNEIDEKVWQHDNSNKPTPHNLTVLITVGIERVPEWKLDVIEGTGFDFSIETMGSFFENSSKLRRSVKTLLFHEPSDGLKDNFTGSVFRKAETLDYSFVVPSYSYMVISQQVVSCTGFKIYSHVKPKYFCDQSHLHLCGKGEANKKFIEGTTEGAQFDFTELIATTTTGGVPETHRVNIDNMKNTLPSQVSELTEFVESTESSVSSINFRHPIIPSSTAELNSKISANLEITTDYPSESKIFKVETTSFGNEKFATSTSLDNGLEFNKKFIGGTEIKFSTTESVNDKNKMLLLSDNELKKLTTTPKTPPSSSTRNTINARLNIVVEKGGSKRFNSENETATVSSVSGYTSSRDDVTFFTTDKDLTSANFVRTSTMPLYVDEQQSTETSKKKILFPQNEIVSTTSKSYKSGMLSKFSLKVLVGFYLLCIGVLFVANLLAIVLRYKKVRDVEKKSLYFHNESVDMSYFK